MAHTPARRPRPVGRIVASTVALGLAFGAIVLAMELPGRASLSSSTAAFPHGASRTGGASCDQDWPSTEACLQARSGRGTPVRRAGERVTAEEHHAPAELQARSDPATVAPEPAAPSQAVTAQPPGTAARPNAGARKARPATPPAKSRPAVADRDIMGGRNEN